MARLHPLEKREGGGCGEASGPGAPHRGAACCPGQTATRDPAPGAAQGRRLLLAAHLAMIDVTSTYENKRPIYNGSPGSLKTIYLRKYFASRLERRKKVTLSGRRTWTDGSQPPNAIPALHVSDSYRHLHKNPSITNCAEQDKYSKATLELVSKHDPAAVTLCGSLAVAATAGGLEVTPDPPTSSFSQPTLATEKAGHPTE